MLTAGTNGVIRKVILPSEFVHIAGLGIGVITTVAQFPVPPPHDPVFDTLTTICLAGLSPQPYTAVTSYVNDPGVVRSSSGPAVNEPVGVFARSTLEGPVPEYQLKLVAPAAVAVNT